jgi:hypothetical protein
MISIVDLAVLYCAFAAVTNIETNLAKR